MYRFIPTLGEQMPFHCEETLTKILGWNERPLHPHPRLEGEVGPPRHDWTPDFERKEGKTANCFLRQRIGGSCVGYETLTIKKINK